MEQVGKIFNLMRPVASADDETLEKSIHASGLEANYGMIIVTLWRKCTTMRDLFAVCGEVQLLRNDIQVSLGSLRNGFAALPTLLLSGSLYSRKKKILWMTSACKQDGNEMSGIEKMLSVRSCKNLEEPVPSD